MNRKEIIANLVLFFGFPIFACIFGCVSVFFANAPLKFTLIMLVFWIAGFFMFFKAKISVIKRGKLVSFGTSNMSKTNRVCYILGYILMGIGLFFSLGLFIVDFRTF